MFEQLFGSKTRVKLLQLFYSNPNRSFYVREITRKIDEQINSVRRELSNLLSIGIIVSDANNNRLYYEVNQEYEHYQAFSMIFSGPAVSKTKKSKKAGEKEEKPVITEGAPEHPLAKAVRTTGHVELLVLTGQFTRDDRSGIDVLIVGDTNQAKVDRFIEDLQNSEGKELRYAVMTSSNYRYRVQINDRFINNVINSKKQVIISSQDLLPE